MTRCETWYETCRLLSTWGASSSLQTRVRNGRAPVPRRVSLRCASEQLSFFPWCKQGTPWWPRLHRCRLARPFVQPMVMIHKLKNREWYPVAVPTFPFVACVHTRGVGGRAPQSRKSPPRFLTLTFTVENLQMNTPQAAYRNTSSKTLSRACRPPQRYPLLVQQARR